jgi:hypothetical protein
MRWPNAKERLHRGEGAGLCRRRQLSEQVGEGLQVPEGHFPQRPLGTYKEALHVRGVGSLGMMAPAV